MAVWIYDPFVVREDVNEEPQIASTRAAGNSFTDLLSHTPPNITHPSRQAYRTVVEEARIESGDLQPMMARQGRQKSVKKVPSRVWERNAHCPNCRYARRQRS